MKKFVLLRRIHALQIIFLSLIIALAGCSRLPNDNEAAKQIRDYLMACCPFMKFQDYFRLDNVKIVDRQSKGSEATIIAEITATAIRNIGMGSSANVGFDFLTKGNGAKGGQVLTSQVLFKFQRFENGWRVVE